MIKFDRVSKRYPHGIDALSDLSIEIADGDLAIVSGHSGAGKSTLLKMITAMEKPTVGTVLVNGQNVGALKDAGLPYYRRNLGIVFQDQRLLFDRSAFDNVMLPLTISGFPSTEAAKRVNAALDKVGLLARAKAMPIALSGGEQQRLAIARAVVNRPKLLIADEPSAHLDARTALDIAQIFIDFHRVGVTVMVSTCDPTFLAAEASCRIALDHGRLTR